MGGIAWLVVVCNSVIILAAVLKGALCIYFTYCDSECVWAFPAAGFCGDCRSLCGEGLKVQSQKAHI